MDVKHGDRVAPQHERVEANARALRELDKRLGAVVLQETEGENGTAIASKAGFDTSYWRRHSRPDEHIGMFGEDVENVSFVRLGHGKTAAVTNIGDTKVVGLHLKRTDQLNSPIRVEQMDKVLDIVGSREKAVVMGDFNGLRIETSRRNLARAGFVSVFDQLGMRRPKTFPTSKYYGMHRLHEKIAMLRGLSLDDIYLRGVTPVDAGVFEGDSDHKGVWADVEL